MSLARRKTSLLEVVISGSLLLVVSFVGLSMLAPVHETTGDSLVSVNLDESAARLFASISPELRQTGFDQDGTDRVQEPLPGRVLETGSPPGSVVVLAFQRRLGIDQWTPVITYRVEPDGELPGSSPSVPCYRLVRVDAVGGEISIGRNITSMRVERVAGSNLIKLRIELGHRNPNRPGALTRVYEASVLPLNPDPDR